MFPARKLGKSLDLMFAHCLPLLLHCIIFFTERKEQWLKLYDDLRETDLRDKTSDFSSRITECKKLLRKIESHHKLLSLPPTLITRVEKLLELIGISKYTAHDKIARKFLNDSA